MIDVHTYDGVIDTTQLRELKMFDNLNIEEKKERGLRLATTLNMCGKAKNIFRKMVEDMGTNANIDTTNGLIADNLILLCLKHQYNENFINILEEQLMDMQSGFCAQGRTHRLYQILLAFS